MRRESKILLSGVTGSVILGGVGAAIGSKSLEAAFFMGLGGLAIGFWIGILAGFLFTRRA